MNKRRRQEGRTPNKTTQRSRDYMIATLIVHGTHDHTVPIDATARPAAKAIHGSKLIEYEGAPHGIFASHRAQLIDDLLRFCRDN